MALLGKSPLRVRIGLRAGLRWCVIRPVVATFVHNLDPVIVSLGWGIALRWYGLAYLLGFLAGFLLLRHLARQGMWVLKPEKTADFIAAAALLGVFAGGRIGYAIFYAPDLLTTFRDRFPYWNLLAVTDGGMASHGGILGLVIFTWFYSRKEKVSWTGLGDGLCVVAPLGLFFGRIANFINGELYGRVAQGMAWAVKFPATLGDSKAPEFLRFDEAAAAAAAAEPGLRASYAALETGLSAIEMGDSQNGYGAAREAMFSQMQEANRHSGTVSEALGGFLEPRHPSQLYEAALEGVALFAILWLVRVRFPKAPHGTLTGLFFGCYAVFRIFGEQFREPDAALVGAFTKGQFLSLFMLIFAAGFLLYAWRQRSPSPTTTDPG
ncbi:MAG: prolipoprotein diacylglyceryl transferase [Verrucomicrobiota bacterium]